MDKFKFETISNIVRENYRTADVFKKYGINYCCGGKVTLADACTLKGLNEDNVAAELINATRTVSLPYNLSYDSWKVDFLVDYIVNVHHAYLINVLPGLEGSLLSFVSSHKKNHPELEDILRAFRELVTLLQKHSRFEEEVIFPYIKQMENAIRRNESYGGLLVRTLRKPLESIQQDEQIVARLLEQLRTLTNNYVFPEDACTNHRVVFRKLQELDQDIIQHKFLEQQILFKKAISLEQELLEQV